MDHAHFSKPELCIDDLLLKQQRVRGELLYKALLSEHVSEYLLCLCVLLLLPLLLWLRCFQQDDPSHYELICLHLNSSPCQFFRGGCYAAWVRVQDQQLKIAARSEACRQSTHTHTYMHAHTQPPNDLLCSKMHEWSQYNQLQKYCKNSIKLHDWVCRETDFTSLWMYISCLTETYSAH